MLNQRLLKSRPSLLASAFVLTLAAGMSVPMPALAATPLNIVELSPTPPNVTQAVAPNIVVTFDDSGSMASNYMGDSRPFDGGSWSGPWRCAGLIDPRVTAASNILSKAMNGVYYNPNVVYTPPAKADGTYFPDADATLAAVPLDGIGINRPYSPVTADATAAYNNNPNGTTDPTGLTDLTGVATYKNVATHYVTFGDSSVCPANADAGSCQQHQSFVASKDYRYSVKNFAGTTGSGFGTVYYGPNLQFQTAYSGSWTRVVGDLITGTDPANTKYYTTWDVSAVDPSQVATDNRWKCGYGKSPMDGYSTDPDGNTYPNGGPYYYRYKSSAPTITVDGYGNPDTAGQNNLYSTNNWEAVAVPNTTVTIDGKSVNQWQNFANWYAYYRTRNLMTRTALSRVFGSLGAATDSGGFGNSIRIAWQNINDGNYKLPGSAIITSLLDASGCDSSTANPYSIQRSGGIKVAPGCYRSAFFNWIFQVRASGGTPNRASTIRAGKFFQRGNGNTGGTGNLEDPYWDPPKVSGADGLELVCRQNYQMLVTDGYWNEGDPTLPTPFQTSQSAVSGNLPDGTPYPANTAESKVYWDVQGSTYTSSLANIAFNYWATNLRPDLYNPANGKIVPPYMPDSSTGIVSGATSPALEKYFNPNNDPANWPHLVQYMVTLGVPGNLTHSDDADCTDSANDLCLLRRGQTNSSGSTGWPRPINNNPAAIDDTWHAAINSRGAYFNAANPQNLVDQLTNILTNISARNVPATTSALNTSVLVQGALGFTAGYSSGDWSGVFQAITANIDGTVSGLQWDAGVILTDATKTPPTGRQILSSKEKADGSFDTGTAFRTFASDLDNLTASPATSTYLSAQALLSGLPASTGTTDTGQARVDYLRGSRALEGSVYRTRSSLLGAIINSQALFVGAPSSGYRSYWPSGSPEATAMQNDGTTCVQSAPTLATCHSYEAFASIYKDRVPAVYVGANDGMLHAFNAQVVMNTATPPVAVPGTDAGKEMFAYIPRTVYPNLGNLTRKSNFKFAPTVDATPVTRDVFFSAATTTPAVTTEGWHTILVGGLRLGGRGVYALDITDPTKVTEANANKKVLWEFNSDSPAVSGKGDPADLGYTFGQPNIGRLANGKWVVLVPGGYFPDCSKSDRPPNCVTLAAASKGYSALFVLDAQTGELIRELKTLTTISGVTSGGLSSVVLGDYNNDQIDDVAFAGDLQGNLWRFDLTDSNPANWQAHVTLAFKPATQGAQPITGMPRLFPDPATNRFIVVFGTGKYLGAEDNTSTSAVTQSIYGIRDKLGTGGTPITAVKSDLQKQTLYQAQSSNGLNTVRGLTDNTLTAAQNGWYIDLDLSAAPGERVVVTPGALFNTNRAIVTTLIPGSQDPCSATVGGALMVLNAATGGSGGGLSGPGGPTGGWASGVSTVGGLVNNPPTGGSVPVASVIGGGKLLIPGLQMQGGGNLNIDDAIWRRRGWRELNNDR